MRRYLPKASHGAGPLSLPCYYQQIIRTILPFIWLFAANGQLLVRAYQHLDCNIPIYKYPMHSR